MHSAVYAAAVRPSVRQRRYCIETVQQVKLYFFGVDAIPSVYILHCVIRELRYSISKNKNISVWKLIVPNYEISRFFCFLSDFQGHARAVG